jgi:hypothetical protein
MRNLLADRRLAPAVAGLAVAGVGLAALGLAAAAPSDGRSGFRGDRIQIALVTPPEPVAAPGPRMEVGALSDGFDRASLAPPPAVTYADYEPEDAWLPQEPPVTEYGDDGVTRAVVYVPAEPVRAAPAEPVQAPPARPLSFGFDQPRRDFAAERRARLEAYEARQAEQKQARPEGAVLRTAEAFY